MDLPKNWQMFKSLQIIPNTADFSESIPLTKASFRVISPKGAIIYPDVWLWIFFRYWLLSIKKSIKGKPLKPSKKSSE